MPIYLLDTNILSLAIRGNTKICERLLEESMDEMRISVITVEEILMGWQGQLRSSKDPKKVAFVYHYLAEVTMYLGKFTILSFPEPAQARFDDLVKMKLGVGKMDLRIAAIALENNAIVVTANTRDFERVPNLQIEDWTV
jgi:tRNA(fMet)-specific endonuclease VapC